MPLIRSPGQRVTHPLNILTDTPRKGSLLQIGARQHGRAGGASASLTLPPSHFSPQSAAALPLPTSHPSPHPQTSSPVNSAPTSSFAYYHFKSLSACFLSPLPPTPFPPTSPLCLPPSVSALPGVSNLLPDFFILPPPSPSPRSPSPTRSLTAYRVVAFSHLGETLKINGGCAGIWR